MPEDQDQTSPLPSSHPLVRALEAYKLSHEFHSARQWASEASHHIPDSLNNAFSHGWKAREARIPSVAAGLESIEQVRHFFKNSLSIVLDRNFLLSAAASPNQRAFLSRAIIKDAMELIAYLDNLSSQPKPRF